MPRSLKERYESKRLLLLRERVEEANKQLLRENRASALLLEVMNQDDLNKVAAIVQKLDTIKSPQLPKLTAAIEQAEAELNKYTGGGPITKAWARIKNVVGIDNPIVKITTFADALERGFSQIPTILKNNGVDLQNVDLKQSLTTILAGTGATNDKANPSVLGSTTTTDTTTGSTGGQNEADGPKTNASARMKNVIAQLQKALAPGGFFGAFKKIPYISSQELAQELVQAPVNVFSQVAKKIQTGARARDVAPDLKSQITGQGQEQTTHAGKEDPTKPTQQSQPSAPDKPSVATTGTVPPGEHPPNAPGKRGGGAPATTDPKEAAFKHLKDANAIKTAGINDAQAKALIKALHDNDMLKSPSD